jgi:APA family basic amino acid/polyamine antiporter
MNRPVTPAPEEPQRHLGTFDAVVIGLGPIVGAGILAAVAPAAKTAGFGLLLGLAAAAVVAYCNATSSAQLAARCPQSGGICVYGMNVWATSGATSPATPSLRWPSSQPSGQHA